MTSSSSPPHPTTSCGHWLSIEEAPRETGTEIIGIRWVDGKCLREPFISFWAPTLQKFFGSPTHFIPMPKLPQDPT